MMASGNAVRAAAVTVTVLTMAVGRSPRQDAGDQPASAYAGELDGGAVAGHCAACRGGGDAFGVDPQQHHGAAGWRGTGGMGDGLDAYVADHPGSAPELPVGLDTVHSC